MFYLFGSPRSGTTILAQCLSAHQDIFIPDETDYLAPMALVAGRIRDPDAGRQVICDIITHSERFPYSLGQYISAADVREAVRHAPYTPSLIVDAVYQKVAAAVGKTRYGDKSPNDLMYTRAFVETGMIGATVKVVHIVRDIRDVMLSLNQTGWADDFDEYFPRIWSSSNLYLHYEMQKTPSSYHLLHYEDFVADPQATLRALCRFLGVDYATGMLDTTRRDSRYQGVAHHSNMYQPVNSGSVGQHAVKLTPSQRAKYLAQAQEAMTRFGYWKQPSLLQQLKAQLLPSGLR
jgi:hypothetical protein